MGDGKADVPVDVAGLMESALMMGIGALEITREKVGGLADELIERGRKSQSEARRMADRVTEAAGKQQGSMRTTVERETRRALDAAGVATHEEIASLRDEIAELRRLLVAEQEDSPSASVE